MRVEDAMQDEYMTLKEAAETLGVSRVTLWRRIDKDGLRVFQSQQDRRQRLVRREQIEALMRPIEIERGKALAVV